MKIKYLGHASFLITSQQGTKVITDPYRSGCFDGGIGYAQIDDTADIVTISHQHDDHNYADAIKGKPVIVTGAIEKTLKDVKLKGFDSYHDRSRGSERGANTIFRLEIDAMTVLHLGDLGHTLTAEQVDRIGRIDILFVPVGGHFTIDAQEAKMTVDRLEPSVTIPMHYKTDKCGFPIALVDDFLRLVQNVRKIGGSEIDISEVPVKRTVYVLKSAR